MRDSEKLLIDDQLHRIIMQHIETLQHWFRAFLARAKYLKLRKAIIVLQVLLLFLISSLLLNFEFFWSFYVRIKTNTYV